MWLSCYKESALILKRLIYRPLTTILKDTAKNLQIPNKNDGSFLGITVINRTVKEEL
jgi:hypothetical protein